MVQGAAWRRRGKLDGGTEGRSNESARVAWWSSATTPVLGSWYKREKECVCVCEGERERGRQRERSTERERERERENEGRKVQGARV